METQYMKPEEVVRSLSDVLEGKPLSCPFGFDVVKFITSVSSENDKIMVIELEDGARYFFKCVEVRT